VLYYFYRHRPEYLGNVKDIINFIVGAEDKPNLFQSWLQKLAKPFATNSTNSENQHCDHRYSCLWDAMLNFLRCFLGAYVISQALMLTAGIISTSLWKNPKQMIQNLTNFDFALFGGLLGSVPQAFICSVRRLTGEKSHKMVTFLAGLLAGLSVVFYRNTEIIMFLAAKAGEALFRAGVARGYLRTVPLGDVLVYSLATTVLFYCAVFEHYNLRPSYWKFLLRVTDGPYDGMVAHFPTIGKGLRRDWNIPTPAQYQ